jgi:membrane protease YdiL (CAAX protease family)
LPLTFEIGKSGRSIMPEQSMDPALAFILCTTLLGSLATCLCLFVAKARGPLLPFEPRRPVPWNAVGCGLAVLMVSLTLFEAVGKYSGPAVEKPEEHEPSAAVLLATMLPEVILVGGVLTLIAVYFRADRSDLGWPRDGREFVRDVCIGATTGVAALAPILLTQALLVLLLRGPNTMSEHPLIKMLAKGDPDWALMIAATVAAVVIAPVCEEIMFRLLLQGWLEKWEATAIGCVAAPEIVETKAVLETSESPAANDELKMTNDESQVPETSGVDPPRPMMLESPSAGIAGMPFGWVPIGISALLFGLAHFGYGPEPIPLFLLGLALGYVYFRTHRIVPSIVAHAIFNSFAMLQLWWPLLHGNH